MSNARAKTHRAFTLIELLVAMVITLIMIALVYEIFSETSQAVGAGVATSDVINNVAAMKGQLQRDFARMLGPHEPTPGSDADGGVLIIINREILNVPVGDSSRPGAAATGGKTTRTVRSDQLVFIVDTDTGGTADREYPVTPGTNATYVAVDDITARYARLWLGHVRRTDPV